MKTLIPADEYGMFVDADDVIRVDSRVVAESLGKAHHKVLRDIRALQCPEDYHVSNFGEIFYKDKYGRKQPAYAITYEGLTLLLMSYNGPKATEFKIAYIRRFKALESRMRTVLKARKDCRVLTDNIKAMHDEPKSYHYSNELDMINRIVLGQSAKQFRKEHGIPDGQSIRPYLTQAEIFGIEELQKADVGLTLTTNDLKERKRVLTEYWDRLIAENKVPQPTPQLALAEGRTD